MFSGIIEALAQVKDKEGRGSGLRFTFEAPVANELKADQSVAHNGVCLTVEAVEGNTYQVTAVLETLQKTNLGNLEIGAYVNLERSLTLGSRIDGHLVQGHVDTVGKVTEREELNGSWHFRFRYPESFALLLVEKGSVTVNGVSLTAFDCTQDAFSVAIIPYTFEHTTFQWLELDAQVNLEFDILGKYVHRQMQAYSTAR